VLGKLGPSALGLGDAADFVYGYLLRGRAFTVEDIRAGTALRPAEIRRALPLLLRAGFAYRVADDPVRYAAAAPQAVDTAIIRKLADLREAQAALGQFAARYHATQLEADGAGVFEVIRGTQALHERTRDMVASARHEALNMVKPPLIAMQPAEHVEPDPSVRGRVVFDRDAIRDASILQAIRLRPGAHYEIRVHTLVPVKMLATDRTMALLPLQQADDTQVGVLITQSAVLDSFLALFDYVWETAVPLHPAVPAAREAPDDTADSGMSFPSPDNRRLLSLLLGGLTDQAIARDYQVSVRTIERRIRALMDAAHVRTRTQLAFEAARNNWL
jgi:DNA-binding CsgD family transcriptional regulator